MSKPAISFVLATHNRSVVLARTFEGIAACGLKRSEYDLIVVDNASTDGTRELAAAHADRVLPLRRNVGSCAKAYGVPHAAGRYLMFLDDDSFPRFGSMQRMLEYFRDDPRLAAVGFTVHLPNGEQEGAALPGVFVGCGVGLRADALAGVGGLDSTFFMQAEEYDLAFRLAAGGWRVRVFDDLHVEHLKTTLARIADRTLFFDARNNLRVVARYLPEPWHTIYRQDAIMRYTWLAQRQGAETTCRRGIRAGLVRGWFERRRFRRQRLGEDAVEFFYRWEETRNRAAALADAGIRHVVLADLGKNIHAFHRACAAEGIDVLAVGDERFAAPGRRYRGTPVYSLADALHRGPDAVIVANTSAVHGETTYRRLCKLAQCPVHFWYGSSGTEPAGDMPEPTVDMVSV